MLNLLTHYLSLGLTLIPLKPRSKRPLVRWTSPNWGGTKEELAPYLRRKILNWSIRCGAYLVVLDFDTPASYYQFIAVHQLPPGCPIVKTGRGVHIWLRHKQPFRSFNLPDLGLEVKAVGNYIVVPPSIHPDTGQPYQFLVPLNGPIPEVDLEALLGVRIDSYTPPHHSNESNRTRAKTMTPPLSPPSDHALKYGRSRFPQTLCGKPTKVGTHPDGSKKTLLSLRCWKWDCPKCASIHRYYWTEKLRSLPINFILRLPKMAKPTTFLRHVGKPLYVHVVANGRSW